MNKRHILAALLVATLPVGLAAAATDHATQGGEQPSSMAYEKANDTMMQNMMAPMTGDADIDFATMMIAHHQGAIDMAKVELQYGKDPAMRKLAQDVVNAQEKEIAFMKAWLATRGK